MSKKVMTIIASLVLVLGLTVTVQAADTQEPVILYTNDVHCAIDDYPELAAYAAQMEADGHEVVVIDAGDAIQGEVIGTQTEGAAIIDIMNEVGYDYAVPGNHEFDYGMETFLDLANGDNTFEYLACNFIDLRTNTNVFDSYEMLTLNGEKVAVVAIATPESYTKSTPAYFQDEEGNVIYGFAQNDFYGTIQKAVDEAIADGAERVVAVGHLGIEGTTDGWKSTDVIANTTGIDVFIDAHSHEVISGDIYKNKDGEDVLLSSTGTKFQYFGELTLSADGSEDTELIAPADVNENSSDAAKSAYDKVQAKVDGYNEDIAYLFDPIGGCEVELTVNDPATGKRVVRSGETNIGDFVADAYRVVTGADVSMVNGGGVRADISVGQVSRKDLKDVNPWDNEMCVISATGQQILDALENGASMWPEENGSFLQVSGLTYEIHGYRETPVLYDEYGAYKGIDDTKERRVDNVRIGGETLDPEKKYTVASSAYVLLESDIALAFKGAEVVQKDGLMVDSEMLIDYFINDLNGMITDEKYGVAAGDGRIFAYDEPQNIVVEINEKNFPGKIFRTIIKTGSYFIWDDNLNKYEIRYDENKDGFLSESEISNVKQLLVGGSYIEDLTGSEYFTSVIELDCQRNGIRKLDLSSMTELQYLICYKNQLKGPMDLSHNKKLIVANMSGNSGINAVNVTECKDLETLDIERTGIKTVDISQNKKLQHFYCSLTKITEVDLSHNPELTMFTCSGNDIAEIDVSNNPKLRYLNCSATKVKTLDLSNNPDMADLNIEDTQIQGMDLSSFKKLELFAGSKSLAWLNIGNNPMLTATMQDSNIKLTVPEESFDITEVIPGIDPSKITVVSGGSLDGNIVSGYDFENPLVYKYDCGVDSSGPLTLNVTANLAVDGEAAATGEDNDKATATGDESNMIPAFVLMLAAGAVAIISRKRVK